MTEEILSADNEKNPLTHPHLRTCATCGCAFELSNPNDVSKKELVCQLNPARVTDTRVRVPDPSDRSARPRTIEGVQRNIAHLPTHPDSKCFKGWCPKGTAPGDNWQLAAYIDHLLPLIDQVFKKSVPLPPVGFNQ